MIPKKIHYVWVGGKDKPADIRRCMATWQKHLQGYEIIEWNEQNFDMEAHPFIKAAYAAKKWAYVSDYIRAKVIYEQGGIYLDTDVLVLEDFDRFLEHRAFVGFENPDHPFTAVFGAEPGHPFIKKMLDYYDGLDSYTFDFKSNNTISVSDILIREYHCAKNNQYQLLEEGIAVYPDTVLCNPAGDSVSVHVFTGTWLEEKKPLARKVNAFLKLRIKSQKQAALFRKFIMRKG